MPIPLADELYRASADGQVDVELIQDATDAQKGVVELATDTETTAGTDTARAVTPAGAAAHIIAAVEEFARIGQTATIPLARFGDSELTPIKILASTPAEKQAWRELIGAGGNDRHSTLLGHTFELTLAAASGNTFIGYDSAASVGAIRDNSGAVMRDGRTYTLASFRQLGTQEDSRIVGDTIRVGATDEYYIQPAVSSFVWWVAPSTGANNAFSRLFLPSAVLGSSPPATVYITVTDSDGNGTNLTMTRESTADQTGLYAYLNTADRLTITTGNVIVQVYSDAARNTPLQIHASDIVFAVSPSTDATTAFDGARIAWGVHTLNIEDATYDAAPAGATWTWHNQTDGLFEAGDLDVQLLEPLEERLWPQAFADNTDTWPLSKLPPPTNVDYLGDGPWEDEVATDGTDRDMGGNTNTLNRSFTFDGQPFTARRVYWDDEDNALILTLNNFTDAQLDQLRRLELNIGNNEFHGSRIAAEINPYVGADLTRELEWRDIATDPFGADGDQVWGITRPITDDSYVPDGGVAGDYLAPGPVWQPLPKPANIDHIGGGPWSDTVATDASGDRDMGGNTNALNRSFSHGGGNFVARRVYYDTDDDALILTLNNFTDAQLDILRSLELNIGNTEFHGTAIAPPIDPYDSTDNTREVQWNGITTDPFGVDGQQSWGFTEPVTDANYVPGGGTNGQVLTRTASGPAWQAAGLSANDRTKLDALDVQSMDSLGLGPGATNLQLEYTDGSGGAQTLSIALSSLIADGSIDADALATALAARIPPATGTTNYVWTKTDAGASWLAASSIFSDAGDSHGDLLATATMPAVAQTADAVLTGVTWARDSGAPTRIIVGGTGNTHILYDDSYSGSLGNTRTPLWGNEVIGLWFTPWSGSTEGTPVFVPLGGPENAVTYRLWIENTIAVDLQVRSLPDSHATEYLFVGGVGTLTTAYTVRVQEAVVRGSRGPAGDPAALPALVRNEFGANVDIAFPNADWTWGPWTDLWSHAAASEDRRDLMVANLLAASQTTPAGGGERIFVEYRGVRTRSSVDTVLWRQTIYPRNLNADGATETDSRSWAQVIPFVVAQQTADVIKIQARVRAQAGAAAHTRDASTAIVRWESGANNSVTVQELIADGGGGGAMGQEGTGPSVRRVPQYVRQYRKASSRPADPDNSAQWTDSGWASASFGWYAERDDAAAAPGTGDIWVAESIVAYGTDSWEFGNWSVSLDDPDLQQFSADSTAWHDAPQVSTDRYIRWLDPNTGQYGGALPLYPGNDLITIAEGTLYRLNRSFVAFTLSPEIDLSKLSEIHLYFEKRDSGGNFVWATDVLQDPSEIEPCAVALTNYQPRATLRIGVSSWGTRDIAASNDMFQTSNNSATAMGFQITFRRPTGVGAPSQRVGSVVIGNWASLQQYGYFRVKVR